MVGGTGSLVIGWLSRGDGAPLELISTVGPADPGGEGGVPAAGTATARTVAGTATALTVPQDSHAAVSRAGARPEPRPLPFPAGACGVPMAAGCADDLDRFVWVPCLAVRDPCPARTEPTAGPGLFETALTALMRRSFGWLVVAERAHTSEPGRCSVRVLVGASGPDQLDVLAPLLTGSAETGVPSYRLRSGTGTLSLAEALSSSQHGRDDGARSPFRVSPAALTALAGLPRLGVPGLRVTGPAGPGPPPPGDLGPVLRGRRSTACGRLCREARACRLSELREAELLATSADHAWLRVWLETLVLALLTDNPLPVVPAPLRRRWASLAARPRECVLARVIDLRVGARTAALRESYDPSRFTAVVMSAAVNRLDGSRRVPGPAVGRGAARPGPAWVIPQLRWLHEMEQLCPLSGLGLAPAEHAPPLDFDLAGLRDWPGIRAGQRVRALRRHPLSMELAPNRLLAWAALAGTDGPVPFAADLAQIMPGMDHAHGLRHAAALMEVSGGVGAGPGWLETVLSWPRRFVVFYGDECVPADAADGPLA